MPLFLQFIMRLGCSERETATAADVG